ncbi:MAG: hypothetical protein LUI07_01080 [Lachnospiraceae bacterium]|nr:hypothetical protein [Lachnospiraceae bacterium]
MKCSIKRNLSSFLSLTLACALIAGCQINASAGESEETSTETVAAENLSENGTDAVGVDSYYLVTNMYGDGQKPWYLVIDYGVEIDPSGVSTNDFEVDNYEIEAVYTNSEAALPDGSAAGNYVLIELSTDYTTTNYGGNGSGSSESDEGSSFGSGSFEDGYLKNDSDGGRSQGEDSFGDGSLGNGSLGDDSLGDDSSGNNSFGNDSTEDSENSGNSENTEFLSYEENESESSGLGELNDSGFGSRGDRSEMSDSGMGDFGTGDSNTGASDTDGFDASNKADRSMQGGNSSRGSMFSSQSALSNQLTVTFQQTGSITCLDGTTLDAWAESRTTDYENNVNLLVENFSQYTFTLSDGSSLMYSLYLPDDYSEDTKYPLVLFMPDATGEGSDEYLALTESLGGVIWTTEEWQNEHKTIVLVPQYETSNTEDPAYTMELVTEIVSQYSVDTSREYLVGQSSGTIRSIKLLIDYPDEFAGALLVAGQTDSAYTDSISQLSTQNIWMICSEGDARAYPGMTEITEAVEAEGTEVTIAQWAATLTDDEQEQMAAEQASAGTTINWTIFDANTVMREDVTSTDATEHMNTWRVAYDLDTVREWLFEQTK